MGVQKQPSTKKQKKTRFQSKAKPKHFGNLVFSGPVPQPGTKGLMTHLHIINESHRQYSVVGTIFNYTVILNIQEHICKKIKTIYCMSAGDVVGIGDLSIDVFLEVQSKRYSQILYLIDYVVPGLHFW